MDEERKEEKIGSASTRPTQLLCRIIEPSTNKAPKSAFVYYSPLSTTMTWKETFDKGVVCFKRGDLDGALTHMNQVRSRFVTLQSKFPNRSNRLPSFKAVISLSTTRVQPYTKNSETSRLLFVTQSASLTWLPIGGRVMLVRRVSSVISGNTAPLSRWLIML